MSPNQLQDLQLQYLEHLCLGCMKYKKNLDEPCACGWHEDSRNDRHQLPAGSSLAGRYMVGRVLGEGGFGITYLGWSMKQNKKVAIKEFYPGKKMVVRESDGYTVTPLPDPQKQKRFESGRDKFFYESQVLAAFDADPNIVNVEDFFKENNTSYIVMEFLEGVTFNQYLYAHGAMSLDETLTKLAPLVNALERIHNKKLLHRDISPDNIMLTSDGGVKLLDFGTARAFSLEGENANTEFFKAGYAPLEQYYKNGKQGPWTDEHALAATIYRAITNSTPPDVQKREKGTEHLYAPHELGANITPAQSSVLLKGMALKHSERYPTVRAFYNALRGNAVNPTLDTETGAASSGLFTVLIEKIKALPQWFAPAVLISLGGLAVLSTKSIGAENEPSVMRTSMNATAQIESKQPAPKVEPPPATPPVEHNAVKTLKDFHSGITQRKLGQAFNCLDEELQQDMGGYDRWAPGFATTVSSTPIDIKIVEEAAAYVVVTYTLETVDDPGGKNYFDGTALIVKTGDGWKIADLKNKIR